MVFRHGDAWDNDPKPPSKSAVVNAARNIGDFLGIRPSNYNYTVKRVIAVGGDTASCWTKPDTSPSTANRWTSHNIYEDHPFEVGTLDYTTEQRSLRCFAPVQVPAGSLLMLGDHRSNSADSVAACRGQGASADCAQFINTD